MNTWLPMFSPHQTRAAEGRKVYGITLDPANRIAEISRNIAQLKTNLQLGLIERDSYGKYSQERRKIVRKMCVWRALLKRWESML